MFIIGLLVFGLVVCVAGNLWLYKYIVKKAVDEYLFSYFLEQHQFVSKVSFPGIFNSGDFKSKLFKISFTSESGKIFNDTYTYIFVKDAFGLEQRYTAKIKTVFLKIYKVELKSGNQKSVVVY